MASAPRPGRLRVLTRRGPHNAAPPVPPPAARTPGHPPLPSRRHRRQRPRGRRSRPRRREHRQRRVALRRQPAAARRARPSRSRRRPATRSTRSRATCSTTPYFEKRVWPWVRHLAEPRRAPARPVRPPGRPRRREERQGVDRQLARRGPQQRRRREVHRRRPGPRRGLAVARTTSSPSSSASTPRAGTCVGSASQSLMMNYTLPRADRQLHRQAQRQRHRRLRLPGRPRLVAERVLRRRLLAGVGQAAAAEPAAAAARRRSRPTSNSPSTLGLLAYASGQPTAARQHQQVRLRRRAGEPVLA